MKALVVFESMFGNTEQVARAIASGLSQTCVVEICDVTVVPPRITEPVDLIVVGGPTHAFSMSRPSTRESAIEQGAADGAQAVGIREWLGQQHKVPHPEAVAMFDTRVTRVRLVPGSAARGATRLAHRLGYPTLAKPESFYVEDVTGPLASGELDRARAWGRQLGERLGERRGMASR
jgi:hypothetical protein